MKILSSILIFLIVFQIASSQEARFRYDTDYPDKSIFVKRREIVREKMPENSIAFLFSAPERNRSNDVDYVYHQSPDFFYLTGFTEANSILVLIKNDSLIKAYGDEILLIPSRDASEEVWTGRMASIEDAAGITGIKKIISTSDFNNLDLPYASFSQILYTNLNNGALDDRMDSTDLYDLISIFKKKISFPPSNGDSFKLRKIISDMRQFKDELELSFLRKAISISCKGHIEMMKGTRPDMYEFEVQAIGEYVFKSEGAEFEGYPSICGSGENSCILHYEQNRRKLVNGDLILLDMGAEYHGYSADVTRTFPVNGKFTTEQKIIYNLVKEAQDSAFAKCAPGNGFRDPHEAAVSVIKHGLMKLGIIKDESEYSRYFMHGTSHFLGLDVHDAGLPGNLQSGNVITVEPGIYIPANSRCDRKWWNIGVRIEDDVLITASGYENLSASCPSDANKIEDIMSKPSEIFKQ